MAWNPQMSERVADVSVAGSWGAFIASFALQWMPVLQFLSLIAATAASIAAIRFYLKRK